MGSSIRFQASGVLGVGGSRVGNNMRVGANIDHMKARKLNNSSLQRDSLIKAAGAGQPPDRRSPMPHYMATKLSSTHDQKVLPPLKHRPKKFLPQVNQYLENDSMVVSLGNIGNLKRIGAGAVGATRPPHLGSSGVSGGAAGTIPAGGPPQSQV